MTIIINPKFEHLRESLIHIDEIFNKSQKTLSSPKNVIREVNIEGTSFFVKYYDKISWRNRWAVRIYKSSKGKRAYLNAALLRERGFFSQEPIAYIAYRESLTRQRMYYVSACNNYRHTMNELTTMQDAERKVIIEAFAEYVAKLHHNGFLLIGFSAENILFDKVEDKYKFSILDTNSLKSGKKINFKKSCKNLSLLKLDKKVLDKIVRVYAQIRGYDEQECVNEVLKG